MRNSGSSPTGGAWLGVLPHQDRPTPRLPPFLDRISAGLRPRLPSPKARPLSKTHSRRAFFVVDPAFGHLATARRWPDHRQRSLGRWRPRLPVDAQCAHPCRDVARISSKPKRPPTALTSDELRRLHQWLGFDEQSIGRDLVDLPSCRPARARETLADRRHLYGRQRSARPSGLRCSKISSLIGSALGPPPRGPL